MALYASTSLVRQGIASLSYYCLILLIIGYQNLRGKDLCLSPRNCGMRNSFCSFPGLPAQEVASPLTKLGVVKTDGRKGEVMLCGYN